MLGVGATFLLTSCDGDGTRKTYPITGTLQIDGKPADAGVLIYLHPLFTETDKYPIHPKGETDAAGVFRITTYNTHDGAPEGAYLMTIEFPQRSGLSPHFSGDLFGGAFANQDANKNKPEFNVTVAKGPVTANLDLKLTPEQRKAFEVAKKKSSEKQSSMFNLSGK